MTEKSYSDAELRIIWEKAQPVSGYHPEYVRGDCCGATIEWKKYGDRNSEYGWEVDHIDPNGATTYENLRPLQWENNLSKSDGRSVCVVGSVV